MKSDVQNWLVRAGLLALAGAAIAAAAAWLDRGEDGDAPRPIAWGSEACSECHMLISDQRFAAQLIAADGRAHSFDDPGCLLAWLARSDERPRALYFHDAREALWRRAPQVAFAPLAGSPMGYDLGAVDQSVPGALSLEQARERAAARGARSDRSPP